MQYQRRSNVTSAKHGKGMARHTICYIDSITRGDQCIKAMHEMGMSLGIKGCILGHMGDSSREIGRPYGRDIA